MSAANGWKSWALGLAVSIAGAFGMVAWSALDAKVGLVAAESSMHAQRIVRNETEIIQMRETLKRIEEKVDRLLEQRRHGR